MTAVSKGGGGGGEPPEEQTGHRVESNSGESVSGRGADCGAEATEEGVGSEGVLRRAMGLLQALGRPQGEEGMASLEVGEGSAAIATGSIMSGDSFLELHKTKVRGSAERNDTFRVYEPLGRGAGDFLIYTNPGLGTRAFCCARLAFAKRERMLRCFTQVSYG